MNQALVEKKIQFFHDVIQKIILNVQRNKKLDILGISDVNACISVVNTISIKLKENTDNMTKFTNEIIINNLQTINNELVNTIKIYGIDSLEDLLTICFGNISSIIQEEADISKFELLKKYFHPTSYKIIVKKEDDVKTHDKPDKKDKKNKKSSLDEFMNDKIKNLDCTIFTEKNFHMKVYGIKLYIYHSSFNKNIVVTGLLDDIILNFINNNAFINTKNQQIKDNLPIDENFHNEPFQNYLSSLSLKEHLVSSYSEIYNNYIGIVTQYKLLKQKSLAHISKEFITIDLYAKRNMLILLLIHSFQYDNKYISYLLYDILSNDLTSAPGTTPLDTKDQIILYDSFPYSIKQYFKDAMKQIIQYTAELSNFDINKIPLEQQICLLKTPDSVKEKAMTKLKEVKAKSEDSGSKARQYLDGLLKIPFQIYIKEPIMNVMNENRESFIQLVKSGPNNNISIPIPIKEKYTTLEIIKYCKQMKPDLNTYDKSTLLQLISKMNEYIKQNIKGNNLKTHVKKITNVASKNKTELMQIIAANNEVFEEVHSNKTVKMIENNFQTITDYIKGVKSTLDEAVHGHDNAKQQIECIIAQWITGEQDGHCFGFEGAQGLGKTSMAKRGLANCLKNSEGNSRPFAFIQMGGDSNGSTLHGHNYTYVGSTWGSIVQILMDKKCMNPIIFIDEIDKISRTEHGREIIGILTHLLDPTQNDSFQDKYFNGIDLDLSKALFVLSYNDVTLLDKTMLDRIHRIKFNNLTLEEKLVISKTHILPEIYKKMGLENMIHFNDTVLSMIIEEYTSEPGVRKLKEILYEIVGEINIDILKNKNYEYDFLIQITEDNVKHKYFKDKHEVIHKKVHTENMVGIANGMWANSMGQGGVIPIQTKFYPAQKFLDIKLTGMQGDVMKESMNVALTLAWNLTDSKIQEELIVKYNTLAQQYGVHINTPEASVNKDGPSAGGCITTTIYSLLNNKKIKCNFAQTGEISLNGKITAIGGLDLKILGSIKSGITDFIYPEENKKDFNKFYEKYKDNKLLIDIHFFQVNHISEVFEIIFE